jgi:hypothetical protein
VKAAAVSALWLAAAAAAISTLLPACSRGDDKPKEVVIGPRAVVQQHAAEDPAAPVATAASKDEPWAGDPAPPKGRQPFQMNVVRTVVTEAGAAKPVNPDDAILEQARVAAGGCFSSLPAGAGSPPQRSAHIAFTVVPSGTVSTANVSSNDTTAEGVLDCIRQQALSTTFSDNGGGPLRTYAIDVRVIARSGAGGR